MLFKLWSGILRRESQPDIIARFQIFLQIFLALEPLNGAGGNVTQAAALGRVGFKTGEEALLWWLPVLDVTVAR